MIVTCQRIGKDMSMTCTIYRCTEGLGCISFDNYIKTHEKEEDNIYRDFDIHILIGTKLQICYNTRVI
jgi:hypothetical protein